MIETVFSEFLYNLQGQMSLVIAVTVERFDSFEILNITNNMSDFSVR